MFKITIEATDKKSKEDLDLLFREVCYALDTDVGMDIIQCKNWNGYSGGDDAYCALSNKKVEVIVK